MLKRSLLMFRPDDGISSDGGGSAERPDWLPPNFDSPEALAKSYDESRREMDRMRSQMEQERAQYLSAIESIQSQPAPQQIQAQGEQSYNPLEAAYARAYEEGDAAAMMRLGAEFATNTTVQAVGALLDDRLKAITPLVETTSQMQRQTAITAAEAIVADEIGRERYAELYPMLSEAIQERPHLLPSQASPDGYAVAIRDVIGIVEHKKLRTENESLAAELAEKRAAQTMSGAGRGSVYTQDQQKAEFERIKNTDLGSYSQLTR